MDITFEDLESITTAVWATMLERELAPDPAAGTNLTRAALVGLVELTGAFEGLVAVHLSSEMIRGAASLMFGIPARDVDDDQMRDTVAELTNMVGGNVKCLVPQPTKLGLPTVHTPAEVDLGEVVETTQMGFNGPDGEVVVAVHHRVA